MDLPECEPSDLAVLVRWQRGGDGSLRGSVEARNTGHRSCRLSGKPNVQPLGTDGAPLATTLTVTLEQRMPPYAIVEPGSRATAPITWSGWDGPPASPRAVVSWPGGSVEVDVIGPVQPDAPAIEGSTGLSSSWFSASPPAI